MCLIVPLINHFLLTPAATATRIAPVCPKCAAIKKSRKLSCCAPGGAWFNNCGTNGDSRSEHTWTEGVRACKDAVGLFSGKAKAEAESILTNQTTTIQQLDDTRIVAAADGAPTDNSTGYDKLTHIILITIFCWSF